MLGMLVRERQFSTLLAGSLLSKIGDGVHELVFILAVLKVTHNGIADAGLIYFFRFIPYLVLGPVGGVLADRMSRKRLMLIADIARFAVTSVFCVMLGVGKVGPGSLAIVGLVMTSFRTIFQPAFQAVVPALVTENNLIPANAAAQIVSEIGGLLGPALGGVLLGFAGNPGIVLAFDACTYMLSVFCVLLTAIPPNTREATEAITVKGLYGDFWSNVSSVRVRSALFTTIIYSSACIFFVGAALRILIPAMLKSQGYEDSVVGYAMTAIALGAILGAAGFSKVASDYTTRNLMAYWCLYGVALACLPFASGHIWSILIACFVLGTVGAFVDVVLPTNIQRLSTDANIGKNFSLFSTLANTGEALSGGVVALLALFSSIAVSVTAIGLLVASVAYAGRLRSGDTHE
ncbi:MFS transporter [Paraburkholderia bannensis]|nr:MFS transporter [Paraburkholderia bannensis]RQM44220.1 MFS transporter [Paraburkholderia bannensis]